MVKLPTQNVALQSAGSLTCKTNRIIAHNLRLCKMLSLQRASPFAPPPSSRQCSYNLHGQFPNQNLQIPATLSRMQKNGAESFGI
jgi:hypothetical protein